MLAQPAGGNVLDGAVVLEVVVSLLAACASDLAQLLGAAAATLLAAACVAMWARGAAESDELRRSIAQLRRMSRSYYHGTARKRVESQLKDMVFVLEKVLPPRLSPRPAASSARRRPPSPAPCLGRV